MHILVVVKRVIDDNVKVRVRRDGTGVETAGVKMSINPFDEVAVEQAVRLKDQGLATQVTVVTCGLPVAQDVLRTALAMGADAATLIQHEGPLDPLITARLVQAYVLRDKVDLVLCGKQDIDDDLGATAPMLAGLLDWAQAVSVNNLAVDGRKLQLSCDADGGDEKLTLNMPAVLSVDLRLCNPRNITLPAMMRAKKAAIATVQAGEFAAPAAPSVQVLSTSEPAARAPGIMLPDVKSLVQRLCDLTVIQAA